MPGCPRGISRNGFKRKDRLVTHLVNRNSNGKISSGHGIPNIEAQRIAIDLDNRAKCQGRTEGTQTSDGSNPQTHDGAGREDSFMDFLQDVDLDFDMGWTNDNLNN